MARKTGNLRKFQNSMPKSKFSAALRAVCGEGPCTPGNRRASATLGAVFARDLLGNRCRNQNFRPRSARCGRGDAFWRCAGRSHVISLYHSFVLSVGGGGSQVSGSSPHAAAPRSPGAGLALAAWRWGGPHSPHRVQSKALKGSQNGHILPRGPGLGLGSQ